MSQDKPDVQSEADLADDPLALMSRLSVSLQSLHGRHVGPDDHDVVEEAISIVNRHAESNQKEWCTKLLWLILGRSVCAGEVKAAVGAYMENGCNLAAAADAFEDDVVRSHLRGYFHACQDLGVVPRIAVKQLCVESAEDLRHHIAAVERVKTRASLHPPVASAES